MPIPEAMAYLMLRPLLDDVAADDMCGVTTNQVFPTTEKWHPLLMEALSGIPDVQAGDSVWWHCDSDPQRRADRGPAGLGQPHVHPRRPLVRAHERYVDNVRRAFLTGSSPGDFPEKHYERTWKG
ncbi:MAG: ybiU [Nocardioides sp.]|nr:ybiU [Nocardioides sp.]